MLVEIDRYAHRQTSWGGSDADQDFVLLSTNWSGATCKMQVRPSPGDLGTAYVTLNTTATVDVTGIRVFYDPDYLHPRTGLVVGATIIRPFISETDMQLIPVQAPVNNNAVLYYDVHVEPTGRLKRVMYAGKFILSPGVTV